MNTYWINGPKEFGYLLTEQGVSLGPETEKGWCCCTIPDMSRIEHLFMKTFIWELEKIEEKRRLNDLVGKNIKRPVKKIKHQDLERYGDSIFKSICPECKEGLLLVRRDSDSSKLLDNDMCVLCGQRFKYIDFPELLDKTGLTFK